MIILVYLLSHQILSKLGKWEGHLKANMMYYHIYLCHGKKYTHHCVITQTLQNGQTLGQFFELLYMNESEVRRLCVVTTGTALPKTVISSSILPLPRAL